MKFAVISDVHANVEALEAVLADIAAQRVSEIYCLGDIIGYGPDHLEAIKMIKENVSFCIEGNHEDYIVGRNGVNVNNTAARVSLFNAEKELDPHYNFITLFTDRNKDLRSECLEYISGLAEKKSINGKLFVHGSPLNKRYDYIHPYKQEAMRVLSGAKELEDKVSFIGHTHLPFFSSLKGNDLFLEKGSDGGSFRIDKDSNVLINVGSVGQPRDGDTRACYVICDDDAVSFRRVKYDVQKTADKLRAMGKNGTAGVYQNLAHRLEVGL